MTLSVEARADFATTRSIWPSVNVGTWESSRRRVLITRIHEGIHNSNAVYSIWSGLLREEKWSELEARISTKRHPAGSSGRGSGGDVGGGVGVGIDLHNCGISAMVDLNGAPLMLPLSCVDLLQLLTVHLLDNVVLTCVCLRVCLCVSVWLIEWTLKHYHSN